MVLHTEIEVINEAHADWAGKTSAAIRQIQDAGPFAQVIGSAAVIPVDRTCSNAYTEADLIGTEIVHDKMDGQRTLENAPLANVINRITGNCDLKVYPYAHSPAFIPKAALYPRAFWHWNSILNDNTSIDFNWGISKRNFRSQILASSSPVAPAGAPALGQPHTQAQWPDNWTRFYPPVKHNCGIAPYTELPSVPQVNFQGISPGPIDPNRMVKTIPVFVSSYAAPCPEMFRGTIAANGHLDIYFVMDCASHLLDWIDVYGPPGGFPNTHFHAVVSSQTLADPSRPFHRHSPNAVSPMVNQPQSSKYFHLYRTPMTVNHCQSMVDFQIQTQINNPAGSSSRETIGLRNPPRPNMPGAFAPPHPNPNVGADEWRFDPAWQYTSKDNVRYLAKKVPATDKPSKALVNQIKRNGDAQTVYFSMFIAPPGGPPNNLAGQWTHDRPFTGAHDDPAPRQGMPGLCPENRYFCSQDYPAIQLALGYGVNCILIFQDRTYVVFHF